MKRTVALNADIGEGMPWDEELLGWITAANVGCGAHAGSFEESLRIVSLCRDRGILVGAHPGYPDRDGFGRRSPADFEREEWEASVLDQLDHINNAVSLDYIKPHGALYHDLANGHWLGFADWLAAHKVALLGMPSSEHESLANAAGVPFIREGFAERGYGSDGRLIPRRAPGAELDSLADIVRQSLSLAGAGIESICIHGDREGCVSIARAVRTALIEEGYSE